MESQQVQVALMDLRQNRNYQLIKKELEDLKSRLESFIFSEEKYNGSYDGEKKYSQLDLLILKRNLIGKFIELPDNLLNILESSK